MTTHAAPKNDPQILELTVEIDSELIGQRADVALGKLELVGSRSKAASLIEGKCVQINGKDVKASQRIVKGDLVRVHLPQREPVGELLPLNLKLDIVFEDDDCLVINKPSGLVVHPAAGHRQDTLVNALLAHTSELSKSFGQDRPGIVHRLDRDTSGLIVVAKNEKMHRHLAEQFRQKTAHRVYWAITVGAPKKTNDRIESILARNPQNRKKFASTGREGKRAITHYTVLADYKNALGMIKLKLETGRTHQIRVHLSEAGFPIAGDAVYGTKRGLNRITSLPLRKKVSELPHLVLHAAELGFHHLKRDEFMKFNAGWPEELIPFVSALGWAEPDLLDAPDDGEK